MGAAEGLGGCLGGVGSPRVGAIPSPRLTPVCVWASQEFLVTMEVQAIGVYRYPHSEADVAALSRAMHEDVAPEHLEEARGQLSGLAVVELRVEHPAGLDLGGVSQTPPGERDGDEQRPYDERWWTPDGAKSLGLKVPTGGGASRVVFFLHEFDAAGPLFLKDGTKVELPPVQDWPFRLTGGMRYEAP